MRGTHESHPHLSLHFPVAKRQELFDMDQALVRDMSEMGEMVSGWIYQAQASVAIWSLRQFVASYNTVVEDNLPTDQPSAVGCLLYQFVSYSISFSLNSPLTPSVEALQASFTANGGEAFTNLGFPIPLA